MVDLMTTTLAHYRPNGTGSLTSIATGQACTPADVVSGAVVQMYPIEKVFKMRQVYTKYGAVLQGDYVAIGGITYAVQSVLSYAALGGMDAYTELLIEEGVSA
jgi:hypothetical protein